LLIAGIVTRLPGDDSVERDGGLRVAILVEESLRGGGFFRHLPCCSSAAALVGSLVEIDIDGALLLAALLLRFRRVAILVQVDDLLGACMARSDGAPADGRCNDEKGSDKALTQHDFSPSPSSRSGDSTAPRVHRASIRNPKSQSESIDTCSTLAGC